MARRMRQNVLRAHDQRMHLIVPKTTALVVCRRAVAIPHGFQRYGSPAHLRVNLASEACSGNHSPCLGVYVFVHFKAP